VDMEEGFFGGWFFDRLCIFFSPTLIIQRFQDIFGDSYAVGLFHPQHTNLRNLMREYVGGIDYPPTITTSEEVFCVVLSIYFHEEFRWESLFEHML
jgi:hypothetical protein